LFKEFVERCYAKYDEVRRVLNTNTYFLSSEAKLQMRDVLVQHCGFPEFLFSPHAIDVESQDPQIDILTGLLVYAFYPNVCYVK
jgi:hypothetical protein